MQNGIPHQRATVYFDIWLLLKYILCENRVEKNNFVFCESLFFPQLFPCSLGIERLTLARKRERKREDIGYMVV